MALSKKKPRELSIKEKVMVMHGGVAKRGGGGWGGPPRVSSLWGDTILCYQTKQKNKRICLILYHWRKCLAHRNGQKNGFKHLLKHLFREER